MGRYASEWAYSADEAFPQSQAVPNDAEVIQEEYAPQRSAPPGRKRGQQPRRRTGALAPSQIEERRYEDYMTGSTGDRQQEM